MRGFLGIAGVLLLLTLGFFLFSPRTIMLESENFALPSLPEAARESSSPPLVHKEKGTEDIEKQPPLEEPPVVVKGIYVTRWSAGSPLRRRSLVDLIERTELTGMVIDIKDFSGFVAYRTGLPEIEEAGAESDISILHPNRLIKDLHGKNIYVIGRISVFQDPLLAKAHPEWALRDKTTGKTWADRKGLSWLDPTIKEVWDYNLAIAKDAFSRGFDEINFDYIRFASDGDLDSIEYPSWDEKGRKSTVITNFFKYIREELPAAKISADLFGLATVEGGDLGIGQVIEAAYEYFDFVSPMVYPSHYASGFLNFENPAVHPYEVIKYSLDNAAARWREEGRGKNSISAVSSTIPDRPRKFIAKLRPWLQDFDLGATYDADMVREEIRAVEDSLRRGSSSEIYAGWLLWDPANKYTEGALEKL